MRVPRPVPLRSFSLSWRAPRWGWGVLAPARDASSRPGSFGGGEDSVVARTPRRLGRGRPTPTGTGDPCFPHVCMPYTSTMRGDPGFSIIGDCLQCGLRKDNFFCSFPAEVLREFSDLSFPTIFPVGSVIFVEGETPRGVFMLCSGRARLTASSAEGRMMIIRLVEAGEMLGLSGTLTGRPYRVTAEIVEPAHVRFLSKEHFRVLAAKHKEITAHAAYQMSEELHDAFDQVRSFGLSASTIERLLRLLQAEAQLKGKPTSKGVRFQLSLTHESIAQMIGSTRETVTRLFSELKQKGLIETSGATVYLLESSEVKRPSEEE